MRGPGFRHDLDVRRTWRCPQCQRERKLPGDVTAVVCVCGQLMKLAGEWQARLREPRLPTTPELTVASFALTEEELARPLPGRPQRPPRQPTEQNAASPRGRQPPRANSRGPRPEEASPAAFFEETESAADALEETDLPFGEGLEEAPGESSGTEPREESDPAA